MHLLGGLVCKSFMKIDGKYHHAGQEEPFLVRMEGSPVGMNDLHFIRSRDESGRVCGA